MPCAICSIRACAARDKSLNLRIREGSMSVIRLACASPPGRRRDPGVAGILHPRNGAAAAIWWHARNRHRLRDSVGAVVRSGRLELEAQPRYRQLPRTIVRRRPFQIEEGTAASIRSMPTPVCRPTPSAANWRRAGSGKKDPLRVEVRLRKGIMFPEKPGLMQSRELTAEDVVFSYNRLAKSPKSPDRLFLMSTRWKPSTLTRSYSTSTRSTPNGITASAGATTPPIYPRKWRMPAPPTGRTATAPGRSC